MQDIYRLMALVAVVEEGSFSAAVNRLHISQPALSARLKLLEDTMGCQLLERTSRGAKPTAMGRMVYTIAVDILKRVEQLEKTVKNHIELGMGAVRLAGGSTAVHALFPRAMVHFRTLYPNIQLTLQECSSYVAIQMVCDGATDVAIVHSTVAVENPQLEVHGLVTDAYDLVAAQGHPLVEMAQRLKEIDKHLLPMHLNKQPMVLYDETSAIRKLIDSHFSRLFIHPTVVMSLRTTQASSFLPCRCDY